MKFRVWTLSLGVICLLQQQPGARVAAEPRPNFALDVPLYGASHVLSALDVANNEVTSIATGMSLTLASNYPGLSIVLAAVDEIRVSFSGLLENVLNTLAALAASTDAADLDAFDALLDALDSVQQFNAVRIPEILDEVLAVLDLGDALPDQFTDAFQRVSTGLTELADIVADLQAAVGDVLSLSSDTPPVGLCIQTYVPPRLVFGVMYAVQNLRAYLPLVEYLLSFTEVNLSMADELLVRLAEEADDEVDASQYVEHLSVNALPVSLAVDDAVATAQDELSSAATAVAALSNVQSVASFVTVQEAMTSFETTLASVSTVGPTFYDALGDIAAQLELLLVTASDQSGDNAEVVQALVVTLVGGGPYARYCFYKYSELLFGLRDAWLVGLEHCIDKELVRLQYLRETLLRLVDMLLFDFQDLSEELTACDSLANADSLESCIEQIATYYTALAANFELKFNLIYDVGVSEATASKNRLLICVNVMLISFTHQSNIALKDEIENCAVHGPYD